MFCISEIRGGKRISFGNKESSHFDAICCGFKIWMGAMLSESGWGKSSLLVSLTLLERLPHGC